MTTPTTTRRTRTALVGLTLAGAGVVGATGVVSAASDGPATLASIAPVAQVEEDTEADEDAEPTERRERRQGRRAARQESRTELAAVLGLDAEALSEQISGGATLADVAAAQGVDVATVVEFLVDTKTDRIDAAVENGRLTQEEADEKAAALEERVQARVDEGRTGRDDA